MFPEENIVSWIYLSIFVDVHLHNNKPIFSRFMKLVITQKAVIYTKLDYPTTTVIIAKNHRFKNKPLQLN